MNGADGKDGDQGPRVSGTSKRLWSHTYVSNCTLPWVFCVKVNPHNVPLKHYILPIMEMIINITYNSPPSYRAHQVPQAHRDLLGPQDHLQW